MRRISVIVTVAVALGVAAFAGLSTGHPASAGQGTGLKCYRVQVFDSKGPNNQLQYIADQFEAKDTIIKKPINFCTLGDKLPVVDGAAGASPSNLVCYSIKDAPRQQRFVAQDLLIEDQFDEQFITITKPYSICTPADKQLIDDLSTTAAGEPPEPNFEFKCYRARRIENDHGPAHPEISFIDQFGGKDIRIGRLALFCTQVFEKKDKAKSDHIDNARSLDPPEEVHVSTISAGSDRDDPENSCVPSYSHSVWYSYYPGEDVALSLSTEDSTYDTVLGIYTGDPNNLTEVACNDDDYGLQSLIQTKLEGNTKYYILVGSYASTPGGKLKLSLDVEPKDCGTVTVAACAGTAARTVVDEGVTTAGPQIEFNTVCYSIYQAGPNVDIQTGDQFNAHLMEVKRADLYCTPAAKCLFRTSGKDGSKAGGFEVPLCSKF